MEKNKKIAIKIHELKKNPRKKWFLKNEAERQEDTEKQGVVKFRKVYHPVVSLGVLESSEKNLRRKFNKNKKKNIKCLLISFLLLECREKNPMKLRKQP